MLLTFYLHYCPLSCSGKSYQTIGSADQSLSAPLNTRIISSSQYLIKNELEKKRASLLQVADKLSAELGNIQLVGTI